MKIPMKGDDDPLQARPAELRFAYLRHQLEAAMMKLQHGRAADSAVQRERVKLMLDDVKVLQQGWIKLVQEAQRR